MVCFTRAAAIPSTQYCQMFTTSLRRSLAIITCGTQVNVPNAIAFSRLTAFVWKRMIFHERFGKIWSHGHALRGFGWIHKSYFVAVETSARYA